MAESECPVCLQSYNGEDTIPRVLGCGHSACESCLLNLPQKYTLTIRCPACNVLVKYPPQGPTSLPKNIELLRLLDPKPPPQNISRNDRPVPHFDFLPPSCSPDIYSSWKQYILPNDAVLLLHKSQDDAAVSLGSLKEVGKSQKVSLVKVVSLISDQADSVFKYSYFGRIIRCLGDMRVQDRDELASLFIASLHETKICRVLGLWADLEDDCLYLVCQRLNQSLQNLDCLRNGDGLINNNGLSVFVTMGLEICEALLALSKQGLIAGCLGFSCFSLDDFGHFYVDSNDILVMGRKVVTSIVQVSCAGRRIKNEQLGVFFSDLLKSNVFLGPEVLFELLSIEGIGVECGGEFRHSVEYGSDVWSLACVLIELLVGKQFTQELIDYIHSVSAKATEGNSLDCFGMYTGWVEKVSSLMEAKLGTEFVSLQQMLCQCLNFDPVIRPLLTDVWKCIRELIFKPEFDNMIKLDNVVNMEDKGHCLVLGEMCWLPKRNSETQEKDDLSGVENSAEADIDQVEAASGVHHLVEGISEKHFKFKDMQGHLDCVTGLAIGGGFLFSSSFDKTVHVWSLQDFSHVHAFKGHDQKVMAVVYVDEEAPLCISGDSGGGIYVWSICVPLGQEPLKKWNELKDWRYSGIHAMTASGKYLYTGSGDKTIKAWSFLDGTLVCTMNGHKSVVSTLAVCNGVLYSGSWDGTIRLWSLSDHSLLTVLGEDNARTVSSVLSLSADQHNLVTSHENGSIKVWRDDVFMKSTQIHNGSIFAICMEEKWLFTGGWDQTVKLQELIGDDFQVDAVPIGSITCGSVITALLYWQGKLFVGYADRTVKVYYYEK